MLWLADLLSQLFFRPIWNFAAKSRDLSISISTLPLLGILNPQLLDVLMLKNGLLCACKAWFSEERNENIILAELID